MTRKIINTGIAGNDTTGDNLYDGGGKINDNFEEIYNAFSDQSMPPEFQKIYATGFFQSPAPIDIEGQVIPAGSKLNIDTTAGQVTVKLPNGVLGDEIHFRDIKGSWNATGNHFRVEAQVGESINGNQHQNFIFPHLDVVFLCISQAPTVWTWKTKSLVDDSIQATYKFQMPIAMSANIPISKDYFDYATFTLVAKTADGDTSSSQVIVSHNGTDIVYEEDTILNTSTLAVPYTATFSIVGSDVIATINFFSPSATNNEFPIDFGIKLDNTIKL